MPASEREACCSTLTTEMMAPEVLRDRDLNDNLLLHGTMHADHANIAGCSLLGGAQPRSPARLGGKHAFAALLICFINGPWMAAASKASTSAGRGTLSMCMPNEALCTCHEVLDVTYSHRYCGMAVDYIVKLD